MKILIFLIILFSIKTNSQTNESTWQVRVPMDIPRAFYSMSACEGKIYVMGGSTGKKGEFRDTASVAMYDAQTNTWENKSPMSEAITTASAVSVDRKIYLAGGQQNIFSTRIKKVLVYDCIKDKWEFKSPMNVPRAFHCIAALNNKLYAIGGRESDDEIKSRSKDSLAVYTIEEYDIQTDKWIIKTVLPFKHFAIGAVTLNNKIYILTDTVSNFILSQSATFEEYDPINNSFKRLSPLTPSRYDAAVTVANNRIYILGGWNQGSLSIVDEYDPATDKWSHKSNLPYPVQNLQAVSIGNSIFVSGGIIYPEDGNEKKNELLEYKIE